MSTERLHEHRRLWAAKPVLSRVYQPWFDALLAHAPRGARVLEIGAGPGFLGEAAQRSRPDLSWVASDLHPVAWCQYYDGGRAWYTALGHKKEHYSDPRLARHILGGILWAMGEK